MIGEVSNTPGEGGTRQRGAAISLTRHPGDDRDKFNRLLYRLVSFFSSGVQVRRGLGWGASCPLLNPRDPSQQRRER